MSHSENTNRIALDREFTERFITALTDDIHSSKHGTETNSQVLAVAKYLLNHPEVCPTLSLEQIIRGTLNMALALEDAKYRIIFAENVGEDKFKQYREERAKWFGDYDQGVDAAIGDLDSFWPIAIPVIKRAAKSPLFMMSSCVPKTLAVYFEYAKQLDNDFEPPTLPSPDRSHFSVPRDRQGYLEFEIDTRKVKKSSEDEKIFLKAILQDFSNKITQVSGNEGTILVAEKLKTKLREAVDIYLDGQPTKEAKELFITSCSAAIEEAKPLLEKELGWGDYLTNLLKSLVNAVISATNSATRSNFTLFSKAKASLVPEVEDIEQNLRDNMSPSN
ncbi:hypothetical protein [Legionella maioricensis]|uniref:Dot/Icm T4SS effector n=1 Tax=Legionella maioricensis TaxID=2896528 RepID=A0A9X2D2R6_9GAMM|nr:hypothetical protein [Legionella maioricensis]MCL9685172.1 hypothetical protein [Legionella maioricensis]MCL9688389.1 hypothetical protein [Legionella maioricensis]